MRGFNLQLALEAALQTPVLAAAVAAGELKGGVGGSVGGVTGAVGVAGVLVPEVATWAMRRAVSCKKEDICAARGNPGHNEMAYGCWEERI